MSETFAPHKQRPVRYIETWDHQGWAVKIYGITQDQGDVDPAYIEIAKDIAAKTLSEADPGTHHHAAFVAIHIAGMFNQVIVDWWARENELRHRVFKAQHDRPTFFTEITHTGEAFCVWELRVIAFERDAWMRHVLLNPHPSLEGYLSETLDTME